MSNLIPFRFEDFEVRVVTIDGEPWFVATDVARALGYARPADAVAAHVDAEDQNTTAIRSRNRGNPNHTIINESGLYALILGSELESAKRFKRWVTSEVLPEIRRTGSYNTPYNPIADKLQVLDLCRNVIERLPGVDQTILAAQFLTAIAENTGIDTESMRQALPPLKDEQPSLNATAVGMHFGVSAFAMNCRLEYQGLQYRNMRGEWELTPLGREYGAMVPYHRNGHSGYQILWRPRVLHWLEREAA